MPTLSNEAEELHRMCSIVNSYQGGPSTSEALGQLFGVPAQSHEYFLYLAAIKLRFRRFEEAAEIYVANTRHKETLRQAAAQLQMFTDQRYWQAGWADTRQNVFSATYMMALDMAGGGLAMVMPVVVLGADEREMHIEHLRKVLTDVDLERDYLSDLVSSSIRTAIRMLELFDIFGSAAITEKMLEVQAMASHASTVAPKGRRPALLTVAAVAGAILTGLISFDGAWTAIDNFYTRSQNIIEVLQLTGPTPTKLLAAPVEAATDAAVGVGEAK